MNKANKYATKIIFPYGVQGLTFQLSFMFFFLLCVFCCHLKLFLPFRLSERHYTSAEMCTKANYFLSCQEISVVLRTMLSVSLHNGICCSKMPLFSWQIGNCYQWLQPCGDKRFYSSQWNAMLLNDHIFLLHLNYLKLLSVLFTQNSEYLLLDKILPDSQHGFIWGLRDDVDTYTYTWPQHSRWC